MNSELEKVKEILETKKASLVVFKDGVVKEYYNHRVKDLVEILSEDENALRGTTLADRKIGKVAMTLMIKAGVKQVYTKKISELALSVIDNKILVEYENKVEYISNMDNTGMCPMENKYKDEKDIEKIYNDLIH